MTEKSKGKKLLTWTLALSMTLALPPVGVFAEVGAGGEGSQQTNIAPATEQLGGSSNESGASNNEGDKSVSTSENGGQNIQTAPSSETTGAPTPSGEEQNGKDEILTPLPTPVSGGETTKGEGSTPTEGKDENKDETTGEVKHAATIVGKEGTTYETLQAAINEAENGDTVVLAKDVTENININKSITLDLNGKTLTGLGDDSVVTITGTETNVTITSSAEEKGKITGGIGSKEHDNLFGGGLFIFDATVELKNLIVTENKTCEPKDSSNYTRTGGGGIAAVNAAVTLNNVDVTENKRPATKNGGGGIFANGGSLTITGSTIEGNFSKGAGGGIFAENTLVNIDTSFIQKNHTQNNGGGIYIANDSGARRLSFGEDTIIITMPEGESSISNTTIGDNIANGLGGGMYIGGGHCLRISNSTITGNRVEDSSGNGQGGGIVGYSMGELTLDHTAITDNEADFGGGIYALCTVAANTHITLQNGSSINENEAANGAGIAICNLLETKNNATLTIKSGSKLYGNKATNGYGGGIYSQGTTITIGENTTNSDSDEEEPITNNNGASICNNQANYGGGIYGFNSNIILAKDNALYNNTATTDTADTAGDDLFLNGGTTFTLPKATDMSGDKILTADGEKITGWFYDGWFKRNAEGTGWDAISRWGAEVDGSKYYDEYTPIAGETTPMALKAAHEQLYKVTVHYVYSDGTQAATDAVINVKAGADYSINSPAIEGYKADKATVSGTISAEKPADTEITVTYTKESSGGGGGGGGHRPKPKPTVEIPDDDALGLNNTDHFAYIVGYGNGEVQPQNSITRAEVAAIFFRLLEDGIRNENFTHQNDFSDVAADAWYCSSVSTLSRMGIIAGYPDGTFRPNAPITRAEFAAIATRFDNNGDKTPVSFTDIIGHWAEGEITVAANHGWVSGYGDNTFRPQNQITRAETMSLVNRVLKRLPETSADLLPDMITWTDNADTSSWYYLPVQEATNSHYYEFKENSKYEKWTELRETRDWSKLG